MSRHAKAPSKNALSDLSPTLRTAVSSTATVGLLALVLTAYAWTTSATAGAMATSSPHRSMAFSYSAPVGKTAVYDSTTVTAPDPIFRRVTNDVTVQYRYHGAPGTISLVAELSAGSGWRYSVPLTTPASFSSTTYSGQTRLHLNALEARAQAAERATGVAAEPLTVTVIPTVRTAGASAFAPKLPLTLSPLELSLADPNHDLTVTDTSTSTRRVLVNRTLTVAGHRLTIGVVRKLATGLLLLSLICAAALVGLARRSAMGGETASIRRRYAGLIVTVAPMPTPAGVAVVDVNDFPTLARIAERYGLFVMYWRRSGVDTFVVQDDATTFRYRVGSGHARANVMAAWEPTESPLV